MRYAATAQGSHAVVVLDPQRKQRFAQLVPQLDEYFGRSLEVNHVPGIAVGIVLDGEVVYLKGFGYQNLATQAPFSVDALFRIASVTKGLTAMAILKLRDEGKLQLDAPAARYYSPLSHLAYPTRDSSPVTVRQLLTHGSGLPEDNYWVDASGGVTDEQLVAMIESGLQFSRAPGSGYEYSNTGYAVLGRIIEHVSGVPAREYIRKEILLPIGMRSSVWSEAESTPERIVVGYRGRGGHLVGDSSRQPAQITPLGVYDSAGGLFASMRDMTKYLLFQLDAWPPRNDPESAPLRRSSVREMQQGSRQAEPSSFPRAMLPSRRPAAVRGSAEDPSLLVVNYGYGLFGTTTCDDVFYVHHDGQLPGYTTSLALYPARGYGLVIFANDERMKAYPSDEVTRILREAGVIEPLGLAPVPALDAARDQVERLLHGWEQTRALALFDPVFWHYQSPHKLQEQLAGLAKAHGKCRGVGKMRVQNLTRGSWQVACERGEIAFVAVLTPNGTGRLQVLLWEDSLPPSQRMEHAARVIASWLRSWDERQAQSLLAPSVDIPRTRRLLRQTAAERGECQLKAPVTSDGTTSAKFALACAQGSVDLSIAMDPESERVTVMRITSPRTKANCAP